jgi:hydrogenase maturation protease
MKPERAETVIIGLGNAFMMDEGIGVRVAAELQKNVEELEGVDVVELGTGGMTIVHVIAGRKKAIVVDCALMGEKPGTMRRFTQEEAISKRLLPGESLHEGDLFAALDMAEQMDECPKEVVIFGVEPKKIAPGDKLSLELETKMEEYLEQIFKELV